MMSQGIKSHNLVAIDGRNSRSDAFLETFVEIDKVMALYSPNDLNCVDDDKNSGEIVIKQELVIKEDILDNENLLDCDEIKNSTLSVEAPVEVFIKEEKHDYLSEEDSEEMPFYSGVAVSKSCTRELDPVGVDLKDEIKSNENSLETKLSTTRTPGYSACKGISNNEYIDVKKVHDCKHCGLSFLYLNGLNKHLYTVHVGEKQFKCKQCEKSFYDSSGLKKHMHAHSVEKPFKCKLCGKSYSTLKSLNYHLYIHKGEKPYKCEHCGKAFSVSYCLNSHLRTHNNGEKPFTCDICGKSYGHLSSLNYHLQIHKGEKPYKCKLCDKSYVHSSSLNYHLRSHTND